ncbi:hypothetical protein EV426DRAFT_706146 [Tirmania nivea]|nr:hypothetical protein EV426DRAFT_706146 [Tirmania nivea]
MFTTVMRKGKQKVQKLFQKPDSSRNIGSGDISTANSSTSLVPELSDGGIPRGTSAAPSTPTTELLRVLPESSNAAEQMAGTEDFAPISAANPSSASLPPGVNGADKPEAPPTITITSPTQHVKTLPQSGTELPSSDLSEQKAATAKDSDTPLAVEVECEPTLSPATNITTIPSLWNKAANDPSLSSQELEALKKIGIDTNIIKISSDLETDVQDIVNKKKGKEWKIKFLGDDIVLCHVGLKILHWVNRFKEIGDIIVQFDPGHAALPWAGFRFLLKICLAKQETVDTILIGLEKIAPLIERCMLYEFFYLHVDNTREGGRGRASQNLEKSILLLYIKILKFLAQAIQRLNENRIKAVFTTEDISDDLRKIEDLGRTVALDADVTEAQSTRTGFQRLQKLLEDVHLAVSPFGPIEQKLERDRKSEILQWISEIPYTEHHSHISESRLDGTTDWLLKREEYRNWRATSASKLLLLRGTPGAGKTYIASSVIDSFLTTPEKLAYFYCNRAEPSRRVPRKILCTLIQQFAQTDSREGTGLLTHVVDIYKKREEKGQKSAQLSLAEARDLLVQITDVYPQITICIDAMDEVDNDTRIDLLNCLNHIIRTSKNVVKIFVTTRMDVDILSQFENFPRIELQPDDNVGDINKFVLTKVQSSIKNYKLLQGDVSNEVKEEICNVLCQRSKGNFQLAALQVNFLCEMQCEFDVKQNLTTLPDTLTDIYNEIYNGILTQKGSAPRIALNAFRWIQCSKEPLSSQTLLDAVMVKVDSTGEFFQTGPASVKQLLTICRNLIILDEKLNTFRFAHLSVDEYLETKLSKLDSHLELSRVCFSLLCSHPAWNAYDQGKRTSKGAYEDRHLLLYSAVFWPWHFASCGEFNRDSALSGLWNKLITQNIYQRWFWYHRQCVIFNEWSEDGFWRGLRTMQEKGYTRLFLVCIFGLYRVFLPILEWEVQDSLAHVSGLGELEIERLLAQVGGTDLSARTGDTPLHCASEYGHQEIAKLLIERGADIAAAGGGGYTPLHCASEYGHQEIAKLLIERGADIAAAGGDGYTPLHCASEYGHQEFAKLLIERGADIAAAGGDGYTPLHCASEYGHQEIAKLLIERGADIAAAGGDGDTPLHCASGNGHQEIAKLLIERGADIAAAGRGGNTPLHCASWSGHQEIAKLLIERGADIAAAGGHGYTPLHCASGNGHQEIAKLLIERGADIAAAGRGGNTPLHCASWSGHQEIAKLLIERGADIAAAGGDGYTPLHYASEYGHQEIAKLLIERGADIAAAGRDGDTPLHHAIRSGHQEVAKLLIERGGADIAAADSGGDTPLHVPIRNQEIALR